MRGIKFSPESKRSTTECCLIAADIDKTLLAQEVGERQEFLTLMAPRLLEAAALGTRLAFLTGNSMNELTNRFLNWFLDHLCHTDRLDLLDRFHFFCNSGGVYAHFSFDDARLASHLDQELTPPNERKDAVFGDLTVQMGNGYLAIHPRFINSHYISKVKIPKDHTALIAEILEKRAREYLDRLLSGKSDYEKTYDIGRVSKDGEIIQPYVDLRKVKFGGLDSVDEATVQITLKPILSFRHARIASERSALVGMDLRCELIERIQSDLDTCGFSQYVARPGGRSSIDVTLQKLDKAYALEFLVDHLNLQGYPRQGKLFGSNSVYLGDEILVGGGNDYPVTRIPGLLVFAVNPEKELVPFQSSVFVPSPLFWGPDAVVKVLADYNNCARQLLAELAQRARISQTRESVQTALDALKREIFGARIQRKIERLMHANTISTEDWQALNAFVTLLSRDDPVGRGWPLILVHMLDTIMVHIESQPMAAPLGIGISHSDN